MSIFKTIGFNIPHKFIPGVISVFSMERRNLENKILKYKRLTLFVNLETCA